MENAYIQHNSSFVKIIKMMNETVVPQTKEVENYTADGKKHRYKHYSRTYIYVFRKRIQNICVHSDVINEL